MSSLWFEFSQNFGLTDTATDSAGLEQYLVIFIFGMSCCQISLKKIFKQKKRKEIRGENIDITNNYF